MREFVALYRYHRKLCRMGRFKSLQRAVWCWL
jgi:hypothetical protein